MHDTYQVTQGGSLTIDVTLRDAKGAILTNRYDGSQALTTSVWPGGTLPASFAATTSWTSPAAGTLAIVISGAQTAVLAPGRYQLLTRLNDGGLPVDAFKCAIEIQTAPNGVT